MAEPTTTDGVARTHTVPVLTWYDRPNGLRYEWDGILGGYVYVTEGLGGPPAGVFRIAYTDGIGLMALATPGDMLEAFQVFCQAHAATARKQPAQPDPLAEAIHHGIVAAAEHRWTGDLPAQVRAAIKAAVPHIPVTGATSDGFHTFDELYRHRMLLTAALFGAWYVLGTNGSGTDWYQPHKSLLHSDGTEPFPDAPERWVIVVAQLPTGQISYHYRVAEAWDLFHVPERVKAAEWDGHTPAEAADRLERFLRGDHG